MKLGEKLDRVKPAINSILRHDDEGIVLIRAAADAIKAYIDAEVKAAEERLAKQAE